MTDSLRESGQKKEQALVSGASGFIGTRLCEVLLSRGYRVRALLRISSDASKLPANVETYHCELSDQPELDQACANVDVIFHVAGQAHVGSGTVDFLMQTNVAGTRNFLQSAQQSGVSRFIYFSSILASQLDDPAQAAHSASAYAGSKKQAEQQLKEAETEHFRSTILRPVNVYGAGMKGNIAGFIRRIRDHKLPPLPRLNNGMSLVSIEDLCEAALLAAENPAAAGQTYVVTDGARYTPSSLERSIYAALGRKKPGWHTPRMVFYAASLGAQLLNNLGIWNNDLGLRTYRNLVDNNEASCEKISTELGYQPSRTFDEELPAILSALD